MILVKIPIRLYQPKYCHKRKVPYSKINGINSKTMFLLLKEIVYHIKPASISLTSLLIMFKNLPTDKSFRDDEDIFSNFV